MKAQICPSCGSTTLQEIGNVHLEAGEFDKARQDYEVDFETAVFQCQRGHRFSLWDAPEAPTPLYGADLSTIEDFPQLVADTIISVEGSVGIEVEPYGNGFDFRVTLHPLATIATQLDFPTSIPDCFKNGWSLFNGNLGIVNEVAEQWKTRQAKLYPSLNIWGP